MTSAEVFNAAIAWHDIGGCVLPVATDGSKAPDPQRKGKASPWTDYITTRPNRPQTENMIQGADGIGLVCGTVSGNIEMLELEKVAVSRGLAGELQALVEATIPGLWKRLMGYCELSGGGGLHWIYRVQGRPVPGNTKLAAEPKEPTPEDKSKVQVLIETRGEGGFTVLAPSNGTTHPTGGSWKILSGGIATIPTLTAEEHKALHDCCRTFDRIPAPQPTAQRPQVDLGDRALPGADWAAQHSIADVLEPAGWRLVYTRGGEEFWRRPGKNVGISATFNYEGNNLFQCFSTSTEFEERKTYSKFGVYAVINHGGNHGEAARELRKQGYGKKDDPPFNPFRQEDNPTDAGRDAPSRPQGAQGAAAGGGTPNDSQGTTAGLLEEFWEARPVLAHIHQFARARGVAPLAMLASVLARTAAATPPEITLPPLVGGRGTLNIFFAKVGPSGAGKGASDSAAEDAVIFGGIGDPDTGEDDIYTANAGSGEGILHAYVTRGRDGKLQRIRSNVLFNIPEVDSLAAVSGRQGATLMPVLRSAWSGEALGFQYAAADKRLTVTKHSYRLALTVGVQPEKAAPLFDDAGGGTPQRFVWVPVTDPEAPQVRPAEPKPFTITPPGGHHEMHLCSQAAGEIEDAHLRTLRGEKLGDELDGHRLYTREKVAAALAILEERLDINADDWRLAGLIMQVSDATRDHVREVLMTKAADRNLSRAKSEAEREVFKADTVERVTIQKTGRAIIGRLEKEPGEWMSTKSIRGQLSGRHKPHVQEAIDALLAAGQIESQEAEYHGGSTGFQYRKVE